MSVEIEFVGGPHDGHRTHTDGDSLNPPKILHAFDAPRPLDPTRDDNPVEPLRKLVYQRADRDGHIWRYQFQKPTA